MTKLFSVLRVYSFGLPECNRVYNLTIKSQLVLILKYKLSTCSLHDGIVFSFKGLLLMNKCYEPISLDLNCNLSISFANSLKNI